ncbi:MAG TPA: SBBP repeat-containing protein, partial [Candidatus Binataceae bacterium]|nr:SBBP repeat-containing protein [Candidatus Binataceae bacterium]
MGGKLVKITGCSAVILGAVVGMLGAAGTISANTGKSLANTINAPVPVDSHRVPATVAKASAAANAKAKSRAIASFLKIPLSFEQNEGQTNSHFKFLSRGPGYELFLSPTSAFLGLSKPAQRTAPTPGHSLKQGKTADAMVRVDLIGANPNAQIEGRDKLAGKVNYLTGRDSSKWHTNIPTFGRVSYRNVYPGVDLAYHGGNQRQLEYDFIVAPGADLKAIELGFAGAKKLSLDKKGNLVLQLANGKLIEHAPVVYQDTEGKRQRVSGRFVMHGKGRVGFAVASYDRSKPLVIDPVLEYSTFLGGEAYDFGWSIATDASGDAFVTGETSSYSFPVTQGALETCLGYSYFDDTCYGADKSAFVSKLNPTGTALIYSTYLGGSYFYSEDDGYSEGYGIAIDSLGDAYVTGITEDYDFPVTYPDSFQFCLGGFNGMDCNGADGNAFVTELTPDGSALVYSTYLGGTTYDYGSGIAVDAAGDAFVTGGTYSDDFPVTMGAFQTTLNGYENAFVTELDPTGTLQIYSSYLGGSGGPGIGDWANGIAINTSGNAYVTGNAYSYDFPVTPGAFQTCAGGPESCNDVYAFNGFVTEFSADGSNLIYSTYL